MRCIIKHSLPGRLRFQLPHALTEHQAIALEEMFLEMPEVLKAVAYPAIGSIAVAFTPTEEARGSVVQRISTVTFEDLDAWQPADPFALAPRTRNLYTQLANSTAWFLIRMLMPNPLKTIWWLWRAIPFWKAGWESLRHGRLDVAVLDAAAIAFGFTQGANNAGETMYLLHTGEILEDFTQKRAESSLAESLLDIPTTAWVVRQGEEVEVDLSEIRPDDVVIVRTGDGIPVDGVVVAGEAMVNQSSLTGESMPVAREAGDTPSSRAPALEEGELRIQVEGDPAESKIQSILTMMQDTEAAKSAEQKQMENIADKLVPWNFALAAVVALVTRSLTKTAAVLMVDYSCALKMSGAIAVMAAQREGARHGFMVKGSRYFQAVVDADTIVFDKTGTLTDSAPKVTHVQPYNGYTRDEALRLAACLEEHFPHPVARAVVNAATEEGLEHRELHSDVEYVVAHGIVSSLNGKRVVIGSQHFVLEDEGVPVPQKTLKHIHSLAEGASPLFLAVDKELRGVIYIDDPLKDDAKDVIQTLRAEGFKCIIMLTGDADRTAKRIAEQAGIEEYRADLMPEDKFRIVRELRDEGCNVCMVGDGVNDSPALAAANVSIAMSAGSAVAREAADIALTSNDLAGIVRLRRLSRLLSHRMRNGYHFAIGFNSILLALGMTGIITPQQSAFFHNGGTVALSAANARTYLPDAPALPLGEGTPESEEEQTEQSFQDALTSI